MKTLLFATVAVSLTIAACGQNDRSLKASKGYNDTSTKTTAQANRMVSKPNATLTQDQSLAVGGSKTFNVFIQKTSIANRMTCLQDVLQATATTGITESMLLLSPGTQVVAAQDTKKVGTMKDARGAIVTPKQVLNIVCGTPIPITMAGKDLVKAVEDDATPAGRVDVLMDSESRSYDIKLSPKEAAAGQAVTAKISCLGDEAMKTADQQLSQVKADGADFILGIGSQVTFMGADTQWVIVQCHDKDSKSIFK